MSRFYATSLTFVAMAVLLGTWSAIQALPTAKQEVTEHITINVEFDVNAQPCPVNRVCI